MKHLFRYFLVLAVGCGLLLLAACGSSDKADPPKAADNSAADWAKEQTEMLKAFYAATNGTMTVGDISADGASASYVLKDVAGSLFIVVDEAADTGIKLEYKIGAVEVTGAAAPSDAGGLFAKKVVWKDFSYSYDLPPIQELQASTASASAKEYVLDHLSGDMAGVMGVFQKGRVTLAEMKPFATLAMKELSFKGAISEATLPSQGEPAMKLSATMESGFVKDLAFIRTGAAEVANYQLFLDGKPIATIEKETLKGLRIGDKPEHLLTLMMNPEETLQTIPEIVIDDIRAINTTIHLQDQGLGELRIADTGMSLALATGKMALKMDANSIQIPKEMEDMASLFILGTAGSLGTLHDGQLDLSFVADVDMEEKDGKTFINANNLFFSDKNLGNVTFAMNLVADTLASTTPEPFGDVENTALVKAFLKVVDTGMVEFGARLMATQAMPGTDPVESGKAMRGMGVAMFDAQCRQFSGSRAELCNNVLDLLRAPGTLEVTVAPPRPLVLEDDPTAYLTEHGDEALGISSSFTKH